MRRRLEVALAAGLILVHLSLAAGEIAFRDTRPGAATDELPGVIDFWALSREIAPHPPQDATVLHLFRPAPAPVSRPGTGQSTARPEAVARIQLEGGREMIFVRSR